MISCVRSRCAALKAGCWHQDTKPGGIHDDDTVSAANDGLRARQEAHEAGLPYITDAELSASLTAAKETPERSWLGEVSSVVLQQALADLNTAYRNFFGSVKGTRKGRKVAPSRRR